MMLALGGVIGLGLPMPGGTLSQMADDPEAFTGRIESMASTAAPASASASASGWAEEIALDRAADGHFYAEVMIDGMPTLMLVDTGASAVALTGDDADALGLIWDGAEIVPVAEGASGPVYGIRTVLPRVSIGGLEAENVTAMIVPEGLPISLLGQSFLAEIERVEISGNRLVLAADGSGPADR